MVTPSAFFHRPSNVYHPAVLSSIEALQPSALQGLLALKKDTDHLHDAKNSAADIVAPPPPPPPHEVTDDDSASSSSFPPPKKRIRRKCIIAVGEEKKEVPAAAEVEGVGVSVPSSLYDIVDEEHINPIHNIIRRGTCLACHLFCIGR